jgi:hypothetical protein
MSISPSEMGCLVGGAKNALTGQAIIKFRFIVDGYFVESSDNTKLKKSMIVADIVNILSVLATHMKAALSEKPMVAGLCGWRRSSA